MSERGDTMQDRNDTVSEVIDGRRGVYGDPKTMFTRAAEIWSGITGHHINAADVPLMLIGYKVLRAQHTPDYSDNSDDIEGYLDIFREIVGEDMIHARSVSEYLVLKEQRDNPPIHVMGVVDYADAQPCRNQDKHSMFTRHSKLECPVEEGAR